MKRIAVFIFVSLMWILAAIVTAEPQDQKNTGPTIAAYNPNAVYTGTYVPELVYNKNSGASVWIRVTRLDRLRFISCDSALTGLRREGTWQGHLNADGSCGSSSEPSDWALGNWLNYRDSLPDTNE